MNPLSHEDHRSVFLTLCQAGRDKLAGRYAQANGIAYAAGTHLAHRDNVEEDGFVNDASYVQEVVEVQVSGDGCIQYLCRREDGEEAGFLMHDHATRVRRIGRGQRSAWFSPEIANAYERSQEVAS